MRKPSLCTFLLNTIFWWGGLPSHTHKEEKMYPGGAPHELYIKKMQEEHPLGRFPWVQIAEQRQAWEPWYSATPQKRVDALVLYQNKKIGCVGMMSSSHVPPATAGWTPVAFVCIPIIRNFNAKAFLLEGLCTNESSSSSSSDELLELLRAFAKKFDLSCN